MRCKFRVLVITFLVAILAPMTAGLAASGGAGPTDDTSVKATARIDVNRAGVEELTTIKGIGPALARRIVEYRNQHGRFESIDDLLAVKGIGPKLLARIRDRVSVSGSRKARR